MAFLRSSLGMRPVWRGAVWRTRTRCLTHGLFPFVLALPLIGQEIQAPEPVVKAAFLYNFTKLVDWPTNAFASTNAPLVIGVLGKDPFGKELDNVVAGRKVGGRTIQVARYSSVAEAEKCHVLFISDSEQDRFDSILEALEDKPILTVGDSKGFVEQGMIELIKAGDHINLRINLEAANRAGLQLSSRLTRLDRTLRPLNDTSPSPPVQDRP